MGVTNIWLIFTFISVFCCNFVTNSRDDDSLRRAQESHRSAPVDERHFWKISDALRDIEDLHISLSTILIERVSGTPQHAMVRQFITNRMRSLSWDVEENEFYDQTPVDEPGVKRKFTNLIARLNPNAKRYLVLACHYDSKLMDRFVGATDSAVPCAMMMNLAFTLNKYFQTRADTDLSLMFIFFDGEEAFKNWNAKDSIYGARHLAAKWHREDKLKHIDVMVLLDLLGGPNPKFYNHFEETTGWYNLLVDIESRLRDAGGLVEYAHSSANSRKQHPGYFQPYSLFNMPIEDDHIPFLKRDVPILHVIPTPFPEVWHKVEDDVHHVAFEAVINLNKIFGIFCLEYLRIDVGPLI